MKLIWEGLDDALHQVLLGHGILALDDDFKDAGQHLLMVDLKSDTIEAAETDDVLTNRDSELIAFDLTDFTVFVSREVLESDPESVHLRHVLEDELNGIVKVATCTLVLRTLIGKDVFHHLEEVIPQEEASSGLLDTLDHLQQILKYTFDLGFFGFDECRTHSDQKIEPWNY